MLSKDTSRSSNQNSDVSKKSMEKTAQSSKQSARDFIRLSYRSTPENPGLYGGMWPGGDGASTSDGSRSQHDNPMARIMEMIMHEKLDMANKLEQANQEKRNMEKTIQKLTSQLEKITRERDDLNNATRELTSQLKQALREKEDLAKQLKEARLGGTSSLSSQRGI